MGSIAALIDPRLLRQLDEDDLEVLEARLNNEIVKSSNIRDELEKALSPVAEELADNPNKVASTGSGPRLAQGTRRD